MISILIAAIIIVILLVLRFKLASAINPRPAPTQTAQSGPQTPTAAVTPATVPAKTGNWSYVAIIAIGLISGIVAYQFEKSGNKENSQKQSYSSIDKSPAPVEVSAPAPMPAAQVAAVAPAEALPIFSEVVIYWGENLEYQFKVRIIKLDNELELEKITYGTGTWHGTKDSRGLYSGTWIEPTARGLFEDIRISPNGNIIATGKIVVLGGNFPLEIRRS